MSEKICTLSIDHAIRIAKIIATAPLARMPMITQLFHQASVDLEGLEELIENSTLTTQNLLIDTDEFVHELTEGRKPTERGYLFTPDEFNRFCLDRNLQPRLVKRHLYAKGYIEATKEATGKLTYSVTLCINGTSQRRVVVKPC
jgi:N-formylglutamate amidohydrolase